MFKKLDFILQKYDELSVTVSDPAVIADQARWQKHIKEMSEMEPIVLKYREYRKAQEDKDSTLALSRALAAVQLRLLDHIIVAENEYVSMEECGYFGNQ